MKDLTGGQLQRDLESIENFHTSHTEKEGIGYCNKCGLETQPLHKCKCPERNYTDGSFSPSDKTVEQRLDEIFWRGKDETAYWKYEKQYKEYKDLLTSATIKAKEDVLRDIITEHVNKQSHVDILVKGTVARYILKYAKENGIFLEEPSK